MGHLADCLVRQTHPAFRYYLILIFLGFRQLHGADLQRKSEQSDETAGVVMVVHISGGE